MKQQASLFQGATPVSNQEQNILADQYQTNTGDSYDEVGRLGRNIRSSEKDDEQSSDAPPTITEQLKQKELDKLRFSQSRAAPPRAMAGEANPFMINTEHVRKKPPSNPTDYEVPIVPRSANSQTHYSWGFPPFRVSYAAYNCLEGRWHSKWLSKQHAIDDHWEAVFSFPQKLDSMEITWTNPPERFRLYFKLDESSKYIPLTELIEKYKKVEDGKKKNKDTVSMKDSFLFHKPLFAKRVRIAMNKPTKQDTFGIEYVKFFEKRTTIMMRNQTIYPDKQVCFWVNSPNPQEFDKIELLDCVEAIQLGDNRELWVYYTDRSIRHYISQMCMGFDDKYNLCLRKCIENDPTYKVFVNTDGSLNFEGFEDRIISANTHNRVGQNFVNMKTELTVTSQADSGVYRKENILVGGDGFWMSHPGKKVATLQVLFGKELKGYKQLKVDQIKIDWVYQPKEFMVYSWRPGGAWVFLQKFKDLPQGPGTSTIPVLAEEFSAIMISMVKPNIDKNGTFSYGISHIFIGCNSMTMSVATRQTASSTGSNFDFDIQYNTIVSKSAPYQKSRDGFSHASEKLISFYKKLMKRMDTMDKIKDKAMKHKAKLDLGSLFIQENAQDKLDDFGSNALGRPTNPMFMEKVQQYAPHNEISGLSNQQEGVPQLGSDRAPAEDCLQLKVINPKIKSGFFYIKTECSYKPVRVYCDFKLHGSAVDIFIENDDNPEPDPDLKNFNIKDATDIREICAKRGLEPLEIHKADMLQRTILVLKSLGYKLKEGKVIPIGYDYSCEKEACVGNFNSINENNSIPVNTFTKVMTLRSTDQPNFLGFTSVSLESFNPQNPNSPLLLYKFPGQGCDLSGVICSTNHSNPTPKDNNILSITCEHNVSNNGEMFPLNSTILVKCPPSCNLTPGFIYGHIRYHGISMICKSAIHANKLKSEGGKIYVNIVGSSAKYDAYSSNGMTSLDKAGDQDKSFTFTKYHPQCKYDLIQQLRKNNPRVGMFQDSRDMGSIVASINQKFKTHETYISKMSTYFSSFLEMEAKAGVKAQSKNEGTTNNTNSNNNSGPAFNSPPHNQNISSQQGNSNIPPTAPQNTQSPIPNNINNAIQAQNNNPSTSPSGIQKNQPTPQSSPPTINSNNPQTQNNGPNNVNSNSNNNINNGQNSSISIPKKEYGYFPQSNSGNIQEIIKKNKQPTEEELKVMANQRVPIDMKDHIIIDTDYIKSNNPEINKIIEKPLPMKLDGIEHAFYKDKSTNIIEDDLKSLQQSGINYNQMEKPINENTGLNVEHEHMSYQETVPPRLLHRMRRNRQLPRKKVNIDPNIIKKILEEKGQTIREEGLELIDEKDLNDMGFSKERIEELKKQRMKEFKEKNKGKNIDIDLDGKILTGGKESSLNLNNSKAGNSPNSNSLGLDNRNNNQGELQNLQNKHLSPVSNDNHNNGIHFDNMSNFSNSNSNNNKTGTSTGVKDKDEFSKLRFAQTGAKAGIPVGTVAQAAAASGIEKAIREKVENGVMNLFGLWDPIKGNYERHGVGLNGEVNGDAHLAAEVMGLGDAVTSGAIGGNAHSTEAGANLNIGIGSNGLLTMGGPGYAGQLMGEKGQMMDNANWGVARGSRGASTGMAGDYSNSAAYKLNGEALYAAQAAARAANVQGAGHGGAAYNGANPTTGAGYGNGGRLGVGSGAYPGAAGGNGAGVGGAIGPGRGAVGIYDTPGHYEYGGIHGRAGGGHGGGGAYGMGAAYGYGKGGMTSFINYSTPGAARLGYDQGAGIGQASTGTGHAGFYGGYEGGFNNDLPMYNGKHGMNGEHQQGTGPFTGGPNGEVGPGNGWGDGYNGGGLDSEWGDHYDDTGDWDISWDSGDANARPPPEPYIPKDIVDEPPQTHQPMVPSTEVAMIMLDKIYQQHDIKGNMYWEKMNTYVVGQGQKIGNALSWSQKGGPYGMEGITNLSNKLKGNTQRFCSNVNRIQNKSRAKKKRTQNIINIFKEKLKDLTKTDDFKFDFSPALGEMGGGDGGLNGEVAGGGEQGGAQGGNSGGNSGGGSGGNNGGNSGGSQGGESGGSSGGESGGSNGGNSGGSSGGRSGGSSGGSSGGLNEMVQSKIEACVQKAIGGGGITGGTAKENFKHYFGTRFEIAGNSNFEYSGDNIKGRKSAICSGGVTATPGNCGGLNKLIPSSTIAQNVAIIKNKSYYDFDLKLDVLFRQPTVAGIAFRMRDQYNYYAFMIDTGTRSKKLIKVTDGKPRTLKAIEDGGIILNDWHSIHITLINSTIKIFIYDSETVDRKSSEKVIEAFDNSFVEGGIGIITGIHEGFCFDKLKINGRIVWTPWTAKRNVRIIQTTSGYFHEDFKNSVEESYISMDGERVDQASNWMTRGENGYGDETGLFQKSEICDTTEQRIPSFVLKKEKILNNGILTTSFVPPPTCAEGIVSVVIKYNKKVAKSGQKNIEYYSFELINSSSGNLFRLRKFKNGTMRDVKVISNPKEIPGLKFPLGFTAQLEHKVIIKTSGTNLSISLSVNNSTFVKIMEVPNIEIKMGLIGVGTCKCKARFTEIRLRPPIITLTEEDRKMIASGLNNGIVVPKAAWSEMAISKFQGEATMSSSGGANAIANEIIGGVSSGSASGSMEVSTSLEMMNNLATQNSSESNTEIKIKQDGRLEVRGWSDSGMSMKSVTSKVFSKNFIAGWEVCVLTKTSEQRNDFCDKIKSEPIRAQCKNDFCSNCCESNIPESSVNVRHQCIKVCYQSHSSQANIDTSDKCINSPTQQNVYSYCENSMSGKAQGFINKCKLDMCNLCCSTADIMMGMKTSNQAEVNCFSKCSSSFNRSDGDSSGGGHSANANC